jgi:nucleoside-diphosphate-sugar epimerase
MLPGIKEAFGEVVEVGLGTSCDWDKLKAQSFEDAPYAIFHFAGAVPPKYSMEECYEINRRLDSAMLSLSKRVDTRFFIYASSVSVYGDIPEEEVRTVSEESERDIRNDYARSKAEMEDDLLKEPRARILRISSPIRQGDPASPGLYGHFLRNRDNIVVMDPYRLQNYITVAMLFDIVMFAIGTDHKITNATAAQSLTNLELARRVAGGDSGLKVQEHPRKSEHGFRYLSLYHGHGADDV